MRILRVGPVTQIALGLAAMACVLVLVAHAVLRVFGDDVDARDRARRIVAETVALQGSALVRDGRAEALRALLAAVAERDPSIGSIALRRSGGEAIAQVGEPARWWRPPPQGADVSEHHVRVPLFSGPRHWGDVEFAWRHDEAGPLARWVREPVVALVAFVFVGGAVGFGLFMRRVMQHLDPSAAIPERVRMAFDSLVEGVAILDQEGRIVLSNRALRRMWGDVELREGAPLAALDWRRSDPTAEAVETMPPWVLAMNRKQVVEGIEMRLGRDEEAREAVVGCAPIRDGRDQVRGCMVSVSDVTEIGRANARLRRAMVELERSRAEVEATNRALERAATRDPLTDCLNRRAFARLGEPLLARAREEDEPLAALLLDIDHFKSVNDRFGHAVGDRVIRAVGATLSGASRPQDVVSRHGGEEFAVLLPACDARAATAIAERLRARIAADCRESLSADVPDLRITVSIGVSDTRLGGATLDALLDEADAALYRAKRGGRDRVCVHVPQPATAEPG